MTEPDLQDTTTRTSAGAMLRAAREKQGLHIAALAAAIKVSPRKLDALENDRWSELPDATFTRALAQTVCRTLKVDAKPVLDKLPAASVTALEPVDTGLNTPFRERPGRDEPGLAAAAIKPMVWGAAALMLAAVVVYFLPAGVFLRAPPLASAPVVPQMPVAPAASAPVVEPAASAVVAVAEAASAPASAAAVVATAASAPQAGGETVFSAPAAPTPSGVAAAPAPEATGILQLRASEASWIVVRDARGATLLSRTVMPGEAVGLDGVRPFSVVVGNAAATQLVFRGQAIDLLPRTRDNVARFELP